jgi:RNA polymerase sigma-70 factor (family 1)
MTVKEHNKTNPFNDDNFRKLFDELYSILCRFSVKLTGDVEAAEDIVQEQFIYIWQHRERLKEVTSMRSYLFTAVRHRSISYLNKKYRRGTSLCTDDMPEESFKGTLPDPSQLLESKELATILEKALESLPVKCRMIFSLKKFSELTNKEIAQKLDISVKTVEAQMTIAFRKLTGFITSQWPLLLLFSLHTLLNIYF